MRTRRTQPGEAVRAAGRDAVGIAAALVAILVSSSCAAARIAVDTLRWVFHCRLTMTQSAHAHCGKQLSDAAGGELQVERMLPLSTPLPLSLFLSHCLSLALPYYLVELLSQTTRFNQLAPQ